MKAIPVLGVLQYNRPDLLQRCIESIDYPVELLVIIQNGPDSQMWPGVQELEKFLAWNPQYFGTNNAQGTYGGRRAADAVPRYARMIRRVVHLRRPDGGVSGGWNEIIKLFPARWWMISANDIQFAPGDLEKMALAAEDGTNERNLVNPDWEPVAMIYANHGASWFSITPHGVQQVGLFDENIHPAYLEDCDMDYRMRLAGVRIVGLSDVGAMHGDEAAKGSCTISSDTELAAKNQRTHGANFTYYQAKWGGIPGQEAFHVPFNKPGLPLSFWTFDPFFRAKQQW